MKVKILGAALAAVLLAASPLVLAGAEAAAPAGRGSAKETIHRSSQIIGMTVKNKADEDIGKIDDVMLDIKTGDVHYLAISYGGFLGLGDKLFAIPLDLFQLRQAGEKDEYVLVLPVDEERLKKAPGFDQDQWPTSADSGWRDKVDDYYGKDRPTRRDRDSADANVLAKAKDKDKVHRASKIDGTTVMNRADKELGEVEDIVIDLDRGKLKYLALSYGGFLGIGDKLFAVPFEAFDSRQKGNSNEQYLVLDIDEETLKSAPGFDQNQWPNFADAHWDDVLGRHYGTQDQQRAQRDQPGRTDR